LVINHILKRWEFENRGWTLSDVIPLKAYQILEDALGKEKAQELAEVLSTHISNKLMNTKESLKVEISEELKKELATKYDLKILEVELRKEMT